MGRKSVESLGRAVDRREGWGRDGRRRRKQLAVWASLGLLAALLMAIVQANVAARASRFGSRPRTPSSAGPRPP